jgi:hypothetical protein
MHNEPSKLEYKKVLMSEQEMCPMNLCINALLSAMDLWILDERQILQV